MEMKEKQKFNSLYGKCITLEQRKMKQLICGFIGKAKDFNIENYIISGIIKEKE